MGRRRMGERGMSRWREMGKGRGGIPEEGKNGGRGEE